MSKHGLGVVGHTSFYAKMVLAKFGVCCKVRTPGSDPIKGGLPNGNVVEVDLEIKCQTAQPILTHRQELEGLYVCENNDINQVRMIKMAQKLRHLFAVSEMTYRWPLKDFTQTRTQSAISHTHHIPGIKRCHFYD